MKILKKFDSYIKEDLEMMASPATKPSTTPSTPTVEPGTKPERQERPTPIRKDRPAVEPDPQAKMKVDATEEEGTYIGTKMIKDLADALGTEVINNAVQYEGKTINFYSETEKFHVDKKKFATVEEVVNYLTGGNSSIEKEMIETEEEKAKEMIEDENTEDDLLNSDEETWTGNHMDEEDEMTRERHIKEFENFMYDEEDSDDDFNEFEEEIFGDEYKGEDEEDEYKYRVKDEKPEWMWNEEDEEEIDSDDECVPCRESHITKKFNNFR